MSQTAPLRPKELSHDYRQKRQNYHKKKQLKNEQDDLDIVPEFYTQLKKVGEGTYAQSVFKAFDSKKGEWVAVKVLKIESETQLRYVNEEVSILEMMSAERNVVSLFESHRVGDRMLLVFEYMDFDLFALMTTRATNSFTEPENKYIMIQILRGLEQMKQHGIMHRDVKAANILVDKSGHVKIGDLGTATRTNRNKFHASVCTLWYRPPELLLGSTNYSYEIDTWAAGCVFVELLSSCFFLRGESEKDQFTRVFEFFGSFPADEFFNDLPRKEWISETTATKKNSTLPYYMQR